MSNRYSNVKYINIFYNHVNTGAFNHILGDFSIIINQFESISSFSAGITRLTFFLDRLQQKPGMISDETDGSTLVSYGELSNHTDFKIGNINFCCYNAQSLATESELHSAAAVFKARNLTVLTPDRSRVILGAIKSKQYEVAYEGIDLDVYHGDRLLIVGPSGCGKSSFLRVVSGLWSTGLGSLTWYQLDLSNNRGIGGDSRNACDMHDNTSAPAFAFFLPQKPYNVIGTLKDQIRYPACETYVSRYDHNHSVILDFIGSRNLYENAVSDTDFSDNYYLDILRKVKLDKLAFRVGKNDEYKGLYSRLDWSKTLSLGEQQRLAFARIIYNKPSVVFLDEATSALDLDSEESMYELLQVLNITYLSVGHRPSLLKYHNKKLIMSQPSQGIKTVSITEEDKQKFASSEFL